MSALKRFLVLIAIATLIPGLSSDARAATPAAGGSAPVSIVRPALSAAGRALLAIQEDAVRRVEALAKRMQGMPEGPARDALEREALEIKTRSEIEFLRAKANFARGRGDLAAARLAEDLIAQRLNPSRARISTPTTQPAAANGGGK